MLLNTQKKPSGIYHEGKLIMAKPLQPMTLEAPGFLGLNTQDSGVTLQEGFALQAHNCLIDKYGRLGSRKGWAYRTSKKDTVAGDNVGVNLLGAHNYIDLAGTPTYLTWGSTTFYKGYEDLTTLTPSTTDSVIAGGWQAATLNDRAYFFQRDYKPLLYTNETTANEFKTIDTKTGYTGNAPKANTVLSAYGRLWAADTSTNKTTVYFSDLLDGSKWGSGSAGSLNIAGTFAKDSDVITGLGAHNGRLIIFCANSIIIYGDNDGFQTSVDVTTLTLVDSIQGIGCISRDSIQSTGEDILFLSATGVRSLGRTIQEKSQPLRDISRNVRDDLASLVASTADLQEIKAVYSPVSAFYLLAFPSAKVVYCFNTKAVLDDGSFRVTTWDSTDHTSYLYDSPNKKLLTTQKNGLAEYFGYQDNGAAYRFSYFTNHSDLGQSANTKVIKRVGTTLIAPEGQTFVVKVGTDYSETYTSYPFVLSTTGTVYEFSSAEYDIAEYSGGTRIENVRAPAGGSGVVLQAGIEAEINGAPFSVQRLDVYVKLGRVI